MNDTDYLFIINILFKHLSSNALRNANAISYMKLSYQQAFAVANQLGTLIK